MTQAIVIAFEGTPIAIRVVPHNSDSTKVVLKSKHPEAGLAVCKLAGIECSQPWMGSNFFMVACDRAEFAAKAGALMASLITESFKALPAKSKAIGPVKCPECGTDDGTHYNYCGVKTLN